jgi:hypothetical protein
MLGALAALGGCNDRPSHTPAGHTHPEREVRLPTRDVGPYLASGDYLHVFRDGAYQPFFVRGVDLGVGMPGTQPGDLAPSYDDYRRWLGQMDELGFDTVRIYTLHFPRFYQALADHNAEHLERPMRVLHGIWLPEEHPDGGRDLYALTAELDARIEETVDAVHGRRSIPARFGQAHGEYDVDVSQYVIGWVVGREIRFDEVIETDRAHGYDGAYEGALLRLPSGRASERWAAARLDHVLVHEREHYGETRPIALSSWMELDPLTHPTEPRNSGTDLASIDLAELDVFGVETGFFASYHVYPYYPPFIRDDPGYAMATDALGSNGYLGVLRDLRSHYTGIPLLVTELGVPASWGLAKRGALGMDHGGHSEEAQALFGARMIENVHAAGCGGAVWFQWMDGWFKPVWITEHRTFPRDRLRLWHDVMSPQQAYGLVAFALPEPTYTRWAPWRGEGAIASIEADADAEFFHLRITLSTPLLDGESLTVGLDTYDDARGEALLPDGSRPGIRSELALSIEAPDRAQLSVMAAYDLAGIEQEVTERGYASAPSDGGEWHLMRWQIEPGVDHPIGELRARRTGEEESSLDAVVIDGSTVSIRLPWTLLQFADPSSRSVIDDDPDTAMIEARVSEGIRVAVSVRGALASTERFRWEGWERAPETAERMRPAARAVGGALRAIADP